MASHLNLWIAADFFICVQVILMHLWNPYQQKLKSSNCIAFENEIESCLLWFLMFHVHGYISWLYFHNSSCKTLIRISSLARLKTLKTTKMKWWGRYGRKKTRSNLDLKFARSSLKWRCAAGVDLSTAQLRSLVLQREMLLRASSDTKEHRRSVGHVEGTPLPIRLWRDNDVSNKNERSER